MLNDVPLLIITEQALHIAESLVEHGIVPAKAAEVALHIAVATVNGVDYLLTWNCTHLANARTLPIIQRVLRERDVVAPIICTPENLMSDDTQLDD